MCFKKLFGKKDKNPVVDNDQPTDQPAENSADTGFNDVDTGGDVDTDSE